MDDEGNNRRQLSHYLRSERAFGLSSVAIGKSPAEMQNSPVEQPVELGDRPATAESGTFFVEALPVRDNNQSIDGNVPFLAPVLSRQEKIERLSAMNLKEVSVCRKCRLCETRTNTVFGEGDPDAKILFIGEGPGENEDLQGRPFVGRAGDLLNKMIAGMGLKREQVYIANIVKCRPPGNRVPAPDEVETCTPYLVRQLEIIRPQVIVTLGLPSSKYMLQSKLSMGKLRGQWHDWRGIKLMPTYHPAFLLRAYTEENRAAVWSDLKKVMVEVGLPIPPARAN